MSGCGCSGADLYLLKATEDIHFLCLNTKCPTRQFPVDLDNLPDGWARSPETADGKGIWVDAHLPRKVDPAMEELLVTEGPPVRILRYIPETGSYEAFDSERDWWRRITPEYRLYRGYEYDLSGIYGDEDEARIEAMRRRDESDSTRKVLACVKRIDTGSDIEVWAVYTRERSVE